MARMSNWRMDVMSIISNWEWMSSSVVLSVPGLDGETIEESASSYLGRSLGTQAVVRHLSDGVYAYRAVVDGDERIGFLRMRRAR